MPAFVDGVRRFQRNGYPGLEAHFRSLADGQSPEALFITCSDSRIDPALITDSRPGDLFVIRNAGNIVPEATDLLGVSASIEFAVRALRVPHVVVCGHSGCGAMGAVLDPSKAVDLPLVAEWVAHASPSLGADDSLDRAVERNVVLQLEHLRAHPAVAERLADGDLELHGWVYDIASGDVARLDPETGRFAPLHDG